MVTKQAMAEQCDVNFILNQYQRTGVITHVQNGPPQFMDLPDAMDLQEAMRAMDTAREQFAQLPAKVRDEFGNDPYLLLAAVQDPSQRDRLIELGVIAKPAETPPPAPPPPAAGSKDGGGPGGAT